MGKHRNRHRYQNGNKEPINSSDAELNKIREQQEYQHQISQNNSQRHRRSPPHIQVIALLENGTSFNGKAVMFNNPNMPKCKVFFKSKDRHELGIDADVNIKISDPEKITALQSAINSYLQALHQEASLEFPAWLEKYSTRVNESNPYFNLDEIREEFKYKKSRFGYWRIAAQLGFFDDLRPQYAKLNRVIHLEIRENETAS
jgi:murein endopeptidase